MTQFYKQQGVALITALLVVSLATVLAVSLVKHLYFDIRRTENILHLDQAQLFNKNSVEFGMVLISLDWKLNKFDSLQDIQTFNDYAIAISFEGPPVALELKDLQSCFNLNNLSKTNNQLARYRSQYLKLLASLKVESSQQISLVDSLIDWLDADLVAEPQGAEFDYYIGLDRPYQTANALMTSISELRLVKGYTDKVIEKIKDYTCVLPEVSTGININTANSIMIESIKGLDGHSETIIQHRDGNTESDTADPQNSADPETNPFKKIADFKKYVTEVLKVKNFDSTGLQGFSEYFLMQSRTKLGTGNVKLFSIIYRDNSNGETKLIQQTSGAL